MATKAKTRVKRCTCVHEFQDKRYGKGRRVHNRTDNKMAGNNYRCTVCGTVKD